VGEFDFYFSFYGLLLSLSAGTVIIRFADVVGERRGRQIGFLAPLLGLFVLLDITSFWIWAWRARTAFQINYAYMYFGLAIAVAYFLLRVTGVSQGNGRLEVPRRALLEAKTVRPPRHHRRERGRHHARRGSPRANFGQQILARAALLLGTASGASVHAEEGARPRVANQLVRFLRRRIPSFWVVSQSRATSSLMSALGGKRTLASAQKPQSNQG
jgi:hypothetical protein